MLRLVCYHFYLQAGHFTGVMFESRANRPPVSQQLQSEAGQRVGGSGSMRDGSERVECELCGCFIRIIPAWRTHGYSLEWPREYCARIAHAFPPWVRNTWSTTLDQFALVPLGQLGHERNALLATLVVLHPMQSYAILH